MEQKRFLVAIVLCFMVLLFWQMFFAETKDQAPETYQNEGLQQAASLEETKEKALPLEMMPTSSIVSEAENDTRAPEIVTVDTPLYTVRISEKGAGVKSLTLKDYRETVEKESEPKEISDPKNEMGTILVGFEGRSVSGIGSAVYTHQSASKQIQVSDGYEKVVFKWQSMDGVVIEKAYTFSPDSYLIDVEVSIMNMAATILQDSLTLSMINVIPQDTTMIGFTGPSAMMDGEVQTLKINKLSEKNRLSGNMTWSAFQDRYFMSTIIPSQTTNIEVRYKLRDEDILESRVVLPEITILPNTKKKYTFQTYFGPKNVTILKELGHQLERVVDFGWFDWMARPCLWIMNQIYRFIPNYGIAIILLTVIIKGVLWPLGNKSYKSMAQMKKMQPLMAELRERYKDDKQKMNLELMTLYKTYKVNPLGGCLPMLVQIPVLFALYRMLYQAVELRHEPFMGWIHDLAAPERMFNFGFSIPFMTPPAGIPVLTILMGLSMFVQQKMQPPMGDPAQAKMMMFMPIFLIFICMNLSSGLVLYWFISNLLSILQQYYVNKKTA